MLEGEHEQPSKGALFGVIEDDLFAIKSQEGYSINILLQDIAKKDPDFAQALRMKIDEAPSQAIADAIAETAYITYSVMNAHREIENPFSSENTKYRPHNEAQDTLSTHWEYNHFKEYLLSLTEGQEFLPIDRHPNSIELSEGWHQTLDQMRKDSQDGIERWALVGFKDDKKSLYLPAIAAQGLPDHVPASVMSNEVHKAKNTAGIMGLVGDIHTHPRELKESIWGKFINGSKKDIARFSAGDLYTLLVPSRWGSFISIVDGDENLFAFRTRTTNDIGINSAFFNQESFERYWYQENGFVYKGNVQQFGAQRVIPVSPNANVWKVNTDIAERHNLVLYRGKIGENLEKVFPQSKKE